MMKANLSRTLVVVWVVVVAVAVALFGVGQRSAETQTAAPKMQDLGTLGGSNSYATGMNDSGQVVGHSDTSAGDRHAFIYDTSAATPKMQDLGTLGGSSSYAKGMNDSGQVVGYSMTSAGEQHAFIYDSTNAMKDLNDLIPADSGWTITSASAINSDGQIAATGWPHGMRSTCSPYAESWDFHTALVLEPVTTGATTTYEVQDLGTLGGDFSYATGMNDSGQVVGYSMTSNCYSESAFLYDANATPKMQNLGTLGGYRAYATGINASGQVVGEADDPQHWQLFHACTNYDCQRAFLYDASATPKMQNLGTLLGDILPMGVYGSGAQDINDSGQVVGTSATRMREAAPHGFLYDASATPKMQDLNTLLPADPGWTIRYAMAINTEGQIAATGYKDGVGSHALLLSPTSVMPPPDDNQAPSPPTIASPQNNSYDSDGSFNVSGSAEAASTVELFDGTTSKGSTQADSTGVWSIALSGISEGTHTYTAKATDATGNTSSASDSVTITVDKSAPTGSVSINDGASRTRSRSVTLSLSASDPSPGGSGVSQMRISNTQSGLSSAPWEAYSTTKAWSLSSGQGTKTVYVQYRDGAGNRSVLVTDTIRFAR